MRAQRTPSERPQSRGLTIPESLVVLVSGLAILAALVPVLGQAKTTSLVGVSRHNLRLLHSSFECYAGDWDDRQFTAVPDDFGVFGGDCLAYGQGCGSIPTVVVGQCDGVFWVFPSCNALTLPIDLDPDAAYGLFRLSHYIQVMHDYVGGRVYDPTYFSPLDKKAYKTASPLFDHECEFVPGAGIVPSSYAMSPAAMYHPGVFRAPSRGGFQHPDTFSRGYESPAITLVKYPHLKTWMIEHNWLVDPPADCNPGYVDPFGGYSPECDPYLFNHGADARPLTLFFDGSIEPLRTGDVQRDDERVLRQTGGFDGLWSRDTPLGTAGYFGHGSFDGTIVSHHILTTDGIRGRDTLRGTPKARGLGPVESDLGDKR